MDLRKCLPLKTVEELSTAVGDYDIKQKVCYLIRDIRTVQNTYTQEIAIPKPESNAIKHLTYGIKSLFSHWQWNLENVFTTIQVLQFFNSKDLTSKKCSNVLAYSAQ